MSKKISRRLTAVAFAAALTLAGTAEAGPLFAGEAGPEASAWSLAWEWVSDVWADLTGLDSATAAETTESGSCGTCANSDSGWGIDPNGKPTGG